MLAVGVAPDMKGELLLYNLTSNRVVIRRTITVIGPYAPGFGESSTTQSDEDE